ncbi:hypothetical protein BN2497_3649 [Janthinobacterium sp. CG23_2]|nr:hypothetical protein BN2497_3649 [Janthinobacterium sp. CG23_2]CUU28222.1 hypothetical protein BN3177_3649 [Janthinobacterium sp. CG23_2]
MIKKCLRSLLSRAFCISSPKKVVKAASNVACGEVDDSA